MPQSKSAIKRVRKAEARNLHNTARRSKMRTLIKKVLNETDKAKAEEIYREATAYLDRMSQKGIIHQNNAARKKARLTKHINNL